ncbi:MAG: cysteine desulfurase NifS [Deltaproteobacteria bacterium]|nr:cysteine desulfurase NifS [Deltaproteobacteria bacterium]MBM4346922.1 cysteine desulfurase NifS [Deltaproteobacteria bacterium]
MKTVYVDNNATTQVAPEVLEAMLPYFSEFYGNPSSMHFFGGQVQKKINEAREKVADFLGAEPSEIVFTSCGTESDNAAIFGTLDSYPEKRHFITSRVEHPAVMNVSSYLNRKGYRTTEIAVDREGRLDLDDLKEAITDNTAIVSIMYANNETGVIFPIEEIGQIVKSSGIPFHTDAVQAAGKIPLNMKKSTVDTLSISGHKLHAPKGIGILYIRKGTKFSPFMIGGHQEKGRRGGTENVPYIIGIGKACELAKKHLEDENTKVRALRDYLESKILEKIPNTLVNGDSKSRLPNTVSVSFEYVEGESILLLLSDLGICASSGSACTSGSLEPSHVLRAMGVPFTAAHGSIRFSLSIYNTKEEMDYIIEHLPPIIQRLRDISPFWKDYLKSQGKK